jgi:hypothetical protein
VQRLLSWRDTDHSALDHANLIGHHETKQYAFDKDSMDLNRQYP